MTQEWAYDLFISYADADKEWVEGYLLDALEDAGVVYHSESAFALGVPRIKSFEEAIQKSKRTLLVISPAFLVDDFAQFTKILGLSYGAENGTWPVIPLIRHSVPKLPPGLKMLTLLLATNETEQKAAIERLCTELQRPLPSLPTKPHCPYPGMGPFSQNNSNVFFGRDEEIKAIVERHLRLHRFLTVIGPSGSGKSSLVFAGLLPELEKSSFFKPGNWLFRDLRPGKNPIISLKAQLGLDLTDHLDVSVTNVLRSNNAQHLLLIVDQFEELFTVAAKEEVEPFQSVLKQLSQNLDCYVILTVRADFYGDLMLCSLWQEIERHRLEVVPLDEKRLEKAIKNPAQEVGVYVEATLVERLIADASGEPGVLPLLQETLVLLWDRVERRFLGLSAYSSLVLPRSAYGKQPTGLQVAITIRADAAFSRLTETQKAIAPRIFLRLIQFGEGRPDTRRQQLEEDLRASGDDPKLFEQTLLHFADPTHRLLTLSRQESGQSRTVDIAHEALISGWSTLQEWIVKRKEDEQTRRRLDAKVQEWVTGTRGLLDVVELEEFKRWLATSDAQEIGYDKSLIDLVSASQSAINNAKLRAQILRWVAGIFMGLLTGITIFAVNQYIQTIVKNLDVLSALTENSSALNKQFEAVETAIEAGEILKSRFIIVPEDTRIRVLANLNRVIYGLKQRNVLKGNANEIVSVNFNLDDQKIVSTNTDRNIEIWSDNGQLIQTLTGHRDNVFNAIFTNKSNLIISGSRDNTIKIWKAAANGCFQLNSSILTEEALFNIALSPNNQFIATDTGSGKIIKLRDLNGRVIASLTGHQDRINSLDFSPNSEIIASASSDKSVKLWSVKTHNLIVPFSDDKEVTAVKFVDDQILVYATRGKITVLDWKNQRKIAILDNYIDRVNSISVSPDRKIIASAHEDGTVKIWDLQSFKLINTLKAHVGEAMGVSFSHNNKTLASAGKDGTVKIWKEVLPTIIDGMTFSYSFDNKMIVTGDQDGNIKIWSRDGTLKKTILGNASTVYEVRFSRDNRTIASISGDQKIKIWTVDGKLLDERKMEYLITSLSFSPDGNTLATASDDTNVVNIWKLKNGKLILSQPIITTGRVKNVRFSSDGKFIAVVNSEQINFYNLDNTTSAFHTLTAAGKISSISFSPDSKLIAAAGYKGTVELWHLNDKTSTSKFQGLTDVVSSISFSPDAKAILLGYKNQTRILFNLDNLKNPNPVFIEQPIESIFLRKNILEKVSLLDNQTRTNNTQFSANYQEYDNVKEVGFSPDGEILASADGKNIIFWNFDLDKLLKSIHSSYSDYINKSRQPEKVRKICN